MFLRLSQKHIKIEMGGRDGARKEKEEREREKERGVGGRKRERGREGMLKSINNSELAFSFILCFVCISN